MTNKAQFNTRHSSLTLEMSRIDLFLKHVCLYKARSEATEDCNGGKVRLNGNRTKAATTVKVGDTIEFRRGDWERKFVVLEVPPKQLSKEGAKTALRDESGPQPERMSAFESAMGAPVRDRGLGRPTKRDRRDLEREFGSRSEDEDD